MKRSARIEKITDLNLGQENAAGKELNLAKIQCRQQEEQLEQLKLYREEYQEKMNDRMNNSASITLIQSYQQFLINLELAITEQENNVSKSTKQVQLSQDKWIKIKNTTNSMMKFADQVKKSELKQELKVEQFESDELSMRNQSFKTFM